MVKKILMIIIVAFISLSCSVDEKGQNLDIIVNGKVTDQNNNGIADVTILIQRGKSGNFSPPNYSTYETVTTTPNGNYSYIVKNDLYEYRICCSVPTGYSIVENSCQDVNHNIVDSKTIPNYINFKLTQ